MQLMALMNFFSCKDHHKKEEAKNKDLFKTFLLSKIQRQKLNLCSRIGHAQAAYHVHFAMHSVLREW